MYLTCDWDGGIGIDGGISNDVFSSMVCPTPAAALYRPCWIFY